MARVVIVTGYDNVVQTRTDDEGRYTLNPFPGDSFHLASGRVHAQPVSQRNREILALAHGGNIGEANLAQRVLDGLPLGIEYRWLQSDIDMRLH